MMYGLPVAAAEGSSSVSLSLELCHESVTSYFIAHLFLRHNASAHEQPGVYFGMRIAVQRLDRFRQPSHNVVALCRFDFDQFALYSRGQAEAGNSGRPQHTVLTSKVDVGHSARAEVQFLWSRTSICCRS